MLIIKGAFALDNKMLERPIPGLLLFFVLCFFCAVGSAAEATQTPQKIASVNLCTDQLLLMLADSTQIATVSDLSLEHNSSFMADAASRHQINHGRAEEILAVKPDLIVAGQYAPRGLLELLAKLGYRIERFPLTSNISEIKENIRKMARLVGAQARGELMIQRMEKRIAKIESQQPSEKPTAAFYQPNGYTSGTDTLQHAALVAAGWENVMSKTGMSGYGDVPLERLLLLEPGQLFTSSYAPGTDSLAQRELHHPVLKRMTQGRPIINIGYKYWICGGPMIADAIGILHEKLPK